MTQATIVMDTPEKINFYVFRATMGNLALEILTGMKTCRQGPILAQMHRIGMIDQKLSGTKKNKIMVLGLMVEAMRDMDHTWPVSGQIARALKA